jgi:hypothetical protein
VLAHGRALPVVGGSRFGLALHDAKDPSRVEVVDGERLALALRSHQGSAGMALSHPAVVTVASCDSGNVETVIAPGASLAHALHEAEVPFVVGSQFPLTFAGSIVLTHVLYSKLLWGADPRVVLHEARQQLKLLEDQVHDWASVVAYTSFPPDFDGKLSNVQVRQAYDAAEAALSRADALLSPPESLTLGMTPPLAAFSEAPQGESAKAIRKRLREELQSLTVARDRLLEALPRGNFQEKRAAGIYGRCASIEKRRAQLTHHERRHARDPEHLRELELELHTALQQSLHYYREGLKRDFSSQWLATQYLSILWLLEGSMEAKWWRVAEASCHVDLESPDTALRDWGHASLIEVYMLLPFVEPSKEKPSLHEADVKSNDPPRTVARKAALEHTRRFVDLADRNSFFISSTRRQLQRYLSWFIPHQEDQLAQERSRATGKKRLEGLDRRAEELGNLRALVQDILDLFPEPTSPLAYPMPG